MAITPWIDNHYLAVNTVQNENPLYTQFAQKCNDMPFFVRNLKQSENILNFLQNSKKPSAMANLPRNQLAPVIERIDASYTLSQQRYQSMLSEALDKDNDLYANTTPSTQCIITAEVYYFTSDREDDGIISKINTTLLGIWGVLVGMYGREDTVNGIKFCIASINRSYWLESIRILESGRIETSLSELNLRIAAVTQDIIAVEALGLIDQKLIEEKEQLLAVKNTFSSLPHILNEGAQS